MIYGYGKVLLTFLAPPYTIKPHQTDFSIQWGFYVISSDSTSLYYFLYIKLYIVWRKIGVFL